MHMKQFHHNLQYMSPVGTGDFAVQLTKSLSRLSTAIFTMAPELDETSIKEGVQYCNFFLGFQGNSENFEAQLQIGSMRFPDAPIQGYTQCYCRALDALGIRHSAAHDIGVDFQSYSNQHFAVMLSTEKVPGVTSSGVSMQGGQEARFTVKNFTNGVAVARRCYIALEADAIIELKAGSCTLLN